MADTTAIDMQPPQQTHKYRDYGGNPLAHILSDDQGSARLPAFGGALEPGLYKPPKNNIANPVPLGLAGFALTTFLLSAVNLGVCGLDSPAMVIGPAIAYGGLCQLLAGMWDFAAGNTFGATALSSYGGFWISLGIILTPGGFEVAQSYGAASKGDFYAAFGLYIFGWFIFTFLVWLVTLKSTLAFNLLFMMVWLAFICLGTGYLDAQNNGGAPNIPLVRAGGAFGMIAAFLAWYNMLAGIADPGNSFFLVPVVHFPWSEKARMEKKAKTDENGDSV